jgi:ferric-dicitrate binding protein FerR (iron transport regulator)
MIERHLFELSLKRYLNNTYTQEDAENVFAGLEDEGNRNLFEKSMDETWDETGKDTECSEKQTEQYKEEAIALLQTLKPKKSIGIRYWKPLLRIAASILILLTTGMGAYLLSQFIDKQSMITHNCSTSHGETKTLKLPDGSLVSLNACSEINYPEKFTGDIRKIKLKGEAWFDVAKNEQPFVIVTEQFNVKVLGTRFNVKAYNEDEIQSINVENGKVEVEMPEATMRLTADEHIDINRIKGTYGKRKENQPVAVWRESAFYFNRTPIHDVVNELERVYNCRIELKKGQLFDNFITGEHSNKNLESVLESIEYTSGIHFRYNRKDNIVFLYK